METHQDEKSLLKEFANWVKDEKISEEVDPDLLLNYLYGCKYRLNTAKEKYKNFMQFRKNTPEWFDNRDPNLKEIQTLLNLGANLVLPEKDEKNRTTFWVKVGIHDPKTISLDDLYKTGAMVADYLLATNSDFWKDGINIIIDGQGLSMAHIFQWNPFILKKTVYLWQHCYPIRFNSINFINGPTFGGYLIKLMKTFMPQKLKERVHVHWSNEDLFKIISPDILPLEFGGTRGGTEETQRIWAEKITKNREWFLNNMNKNYLIKDC